MADVKVYFLGDGELGSPQTYIKIGKSQDPVSRMATLQTGNPRRLRIFTAIKERLVDTPTGEISLDESYFHNLFRFERIDSSEWFRSSPALERGILWLKIFGSKINNSDDLVSLQMAVTSEYPHSEVKFRFMEFLQ
jgi:hypothetical protein